MRSNPYDMTSKGLQRHIRTPGQGYLALAAVLFGQNIQRPEWQREAACRDSPHEAWFAEGRGSDQYDAHLWNTYCSQCPVITQCQEDAFLWDDVHSVSSQVVVGFAGGISARERQRMLKAQRQRERQRRSGDNTAA